MNALTEQTRLSERIGKIVTGMPHQIGTGFTAHHFSEEMFDGRMDPLLMVDHFVMTEPTFEPHLHAGISAVTAMFEDSAGNFLNRDTLGHNIALKGGDLYWLAAASGAAHEEKPDDGARVHALQIFVNLPANLKKEPARALLVRAEEVPVLEGRNHRVRVVLGRSGEAVGNDGTPEAITMLDGFIDKGARFTHALPIEHQAFLYAVSGELTVRLHNEERVLAAGSATTIVAGEEADIVLSADVPTHFVLIAGRPIRERFIKHGPLVMTTVADVQRTIADYVHGKFGRIPG